MNQKQLKEMLRQHKIWLKSGEERGIRCYLRAVELSGVNLSHANLSHAWLTRTSLSHADLSHADLTDAYLISVDLTHADLTNANMCGISLSFCNLVGAKFRNELNESYALVGCTMSWSQSAWVTNHPDFKMITFI